jgi:hypothetical protein
VILTERDERVLVGISLAADRPRLERVARVVLDRDDAVTQLLRAAALAGDHHDEAWRQIRDVCQRRRGNPFNLLDLIVEISQQEMERRGQPRRASSHSSARGGEENTESGPSRVEPVSEEPGPMSKRTRSWGCAGGVDLRASGPLPGGVLADRPGGTLTANLDPRRLGAPKTKVAGATLATPPGPEHRSYTYAQLA